MADATAYQVADHARRLEEHSQLPGFFSGFGSPYLLPRVGLSTGCLVSLNRWRSAIEWYRSYDYASTWRVK